MEPDLLAADIAISFAKIHLRLTCNMAERDKQLAQSEGDQSHVLAHNCIAPRKTPLIVQALKNPVCRMALLFVNALVAVKHTVNPCGMSLKLLRHRPLTPAVLHITASWLSCCGALQNAAPLLSGSGLQS